MSCHDTVNLYRIWWIYRGGGKKVIVSRKQLATISGKRQFEWISVTTGTCANLSALRPSAFSLANSIKEQEAAFMFVENTSTLPLEADRRPTTEPAPRREITGPVETNYQFVVSKHSECQSKIQQWTICIFLLCISIKKNALIIWKWCQTCVVPLLLSCRFNFTTSPHGFYEFIWKLNWIKSTKKIS